MFLFMIPESAQPTKVSSTITALIRLLTRMYTLMYTKIILSRIFLMTYITDNLRVCSNPSTAITNWRASTTDSRAVMMGYARNCSRMHDRSGRCVRVIVGDGHGICEFGKNGVGRNGMLDGSVMRQKKCVERWIVSGD